MSTTKPDTDTGWSKEWPKVTGYYWRRINDHDYPSLVRIVGDTCRFSDGSSEGRYECYEFAGPLSPSDFEQLIRLRKQTSLFDEVVRDLEMRTCYGCNNRIGWNETPTKYGDWTKCSSCRNARALLKQVAALREALTPTGEQS